MICLSFNATYNNTTGNNRGTVIIHANAISIIYRIKKIIV